MSNENVAASSAKGTDEQKKTQATTDEQKSAQGSEPKKKRRRRRRSRRSRNKDTQKAATEEKSEAKPAEKTAKGQEAQPEGQKKKRRRRRRRRKKSTQAQGAEATENQEAKPAQQKEQEKKPRKRRPRNKSQKEGERKKPAETRKSKERNKNRPEKKNEQSNYSGSKGGRKKKQKKKNYQKKKSERPIKLRDNRKKTPHKRVDYRKQREERRDNQKRNQIYEIPEFLTVGQLADTLDIAATEVITELMRNGTMATINQQIDADTAEIVASELGFNVKPITTEDVVAKIFEEYDKTITGKEAKRPPVVTVMGHVDHGKTSLLDKIRKTNVIAGEAGGITQHIGAYTVNINNEQITFIDTPGHAAFTAMRSRGAQMTDIAVLVVAADDGVMPQTVEAINHAKAAEVPIIVAINKIDRPGTNPDMIKQELTEHEILVEEWGGDTLAVPISAKEGTNIQELLEDILLVAEMQELKADPDRPARGSVIEAEVKQGKGATASLLIKQGTLHIGDVIFSGTTYGKIRAMIDDKGRRIRKAGPSTPVEVSGLSGIPEAGQDFIVLSSEREARDLAANELELQKKEQRQKSSVSLDDIFERFKEGEVNEVNLIVKADVQGSVEAITQSLENLNTDEVRVNVVHGAVGAVNENDVLLANTTDAIIIAFNVRADKIARESAEKENIDIRYYTVIYDAIEDVKNAMEGLLKPDFVENQLGEAEVREVFKLPGGVMVAGSYVTDGSISRNSQARLVREGVIVYQGNINTLRRYKDDVKEVQQGFECGITIENMNDIKVGDMIETFEMQEVKREL